MTYNGVKSHKKAGLRPLSLKNKFFNKRLRKESNLFPGLFRVKFSIYTAVWNMHSVNTNFKYISFFLYSQIKILSVTNCVHQCNSHSRIFKHVFFLYVNCFFLCPRHTESEYTWIVDFLDLLCLISRSIFRSFLKYLFNWFCFDGPSFIQDIWSKKSSQ